MQRSIIVVLFALLAALPACSDATAPITIEGLAPYSDALLAYEWQRVESCSGLKGDFSAVTFYTATKIVYQGQTYRAIWRREDNAIIFSESLEHAPVAIQHEEMHALLHGGGHPDHYFKGVCGDLMILSG